MIRRPGRRLVPWLCALATLAAAGCSHTAPYVHPQYAPPAPAGGAPEYRLLLLGDAGEPGPADATLAAARRWAGEWPDRTLVVFLGDNAYPVGFTARRHDDAAQRIDSQLQVVEDSAAEALFVPGNHDWAKGRPEGLEAVLAQEAYLRGRARFLPEGGCPGPATLDLPAAAPALRLIVLDTQWWLHRFDRPTGTCPAGTPEAVVEALGRALDTDLPVVVAAHHPLATHGPHGGFYDWRIHLFPLTEWAGWLWVPLPGLGSLYPLVQWHVVRSDQDLRGAGNRKMREALSRALASRRGGPVFFAAGHEHSLQILRGDAVDYILVSGAGSRTKISPVGSGSRTVFARAHQGFMALDVGGSAVRVSVVQPSAGGREEVFDLLVARPPADNPR